MSGGKAKLLGRWGETLTAAELRRKGWKVLAAEYRSRFGEIDLMTATDKYLSLIEVKLRTEEHFVLGREAVNRRRQAHLHATAELYLAEHPEETRQPRFNVAKIYVPQGTATRRPRITWLENVFQGEFQVEQYAIDLSDGYCDAVFLRHLSGGGLRRNNDHVDLERMGKYRRCAQFFALFEEPEPIPVRDLSGKTHRELSLEGYTLSEREMTVNADLVTFCHTGAGAKTAFQSGRWVVFLSVEGAELLDCSLERLGEAHAIGVQAINPTWDHVNALSGTNAEEPERGLTPQGRALVHRMERLGMLVDMSHLSDPDFQDVTEKLSSPSFTSHSSARTAFSHLRNLADEQFTAIISHSGMVGLNLYANFLGERADLDTAIAHLKRWLELGGERAVALSGDLNGYSSLSEGITGIQNLGRLWERLLQRNYSEALVRALFFENLMGVVGEVYTM